MYLREARDLIDVALGFQKADLVITNGCLVNVSTGEFLEKCGVAVKNGRIALVGDVSKVKCDRSNTIDVKGFYILPGLIDGHIHIESSMLTLTQFAKGVLPRGTTSVVIDPHEIGNVLGLRGIKLILNESRRLPLKVFIVIPSCIPATSGLETSGAKIDVNDVKRALSWKNVIGLGEVMNFQGIFDKNLDLLRKIEATNKVGKIIEGHAPRLTEAQLNAYTCTGITSNHEVFTGEEALQNLRLGIKLEIRESSTMKNLKGILKKLIRTNIDPRGCLLVSDDRNAADLQEEGHLDHIVKCAIGEGLDPIRALQMVTINPAEHFGLIRNVGILAPGRIADILVIRRLEDMKVKTVIANGFIIAENGFLTTDIGKAKYPSYAKKTIRIGRRLLAEDFDVRARKPFVSLNVMVIEIIEGVGVTKKRIFSLRVSNGLVMADPSIDVLKIGVVERHKGIGNVGVGFVKGFGLKKGALASSIGHDAHNIVVVGTRSEDMAFAANFLCDMNGGLVVANSGHILANLALPIAGLMSEHSIEKVAKELGNLRKAARKLGVKVDEPFVSLSFMPLTVIPELRITDKGIVDVDTSNIVNTLIDQ